MELHEDSTDFTKTGYIEIARKKSVRPVNILWLNIIGLVTVVFAIVSVGCAYVNNFVAMGCSAAAAIISSLCGTAFLWQSQRQMQDKIDALTTIIERNPKSSKELLEDSETE